MAEQLVCPCQSGNAYAACCEPLHRGAHARSAEALMRSRYSAYVLQEIAYLFETALPSQRVFLDHEAIADWSAHTDWRGLTVLAHRSFGRHAQVEFIAHFFEGEPREHRECSLFVQINSRWFFVDATLPLPTRRSPCVCGSGKRFNQCCGAFL